MIREWFIGNSICYGTVAIEAFLNRHEYSYIIRAHEACAQGVHLSKSARVLTVFSTSKDHGLGKVGQKCWPEQPIS